MADGYDDPRESPPVYGSTSVSVLETGDNVFSSFAAAFSSFRSFHHNRGFVAIYQSLARIAVLECQTSRSAPASPVTPPAAATARV